MENNTFDSLFTSGKLQMLKILLPCLPTDKRGGLSIFIRMQELLYTMHYVQNTGNKVTMDDPPEGDALFDALLPYCDPAMKAQMQGLRQTMKQYEQLKDAMDMMQMMKDVFPEGFSGDAVDLSAMTELFGVHLQNES
ncbi:MAG: hypothetical protein K6F51_02825 [Acetatifactor sp.]|nr:hypothetical protein [Acetatifactor sp.]